MRVPGVWTENYCRCKRRCFDTFILKPQQVWFFRRTTRSQMGDNSLDIHSLTDRVLVMGNFYENDKLNEVRSFFGTNYAGRYTIYNVSSEAEFNIEQDMDHVRNYPFNSNNPCAIKAIIAFCVDVEAFLNASSDNVIAIHCRTGKIIFSFVKAYEVIFHLYDSK